MGEKAFSKKDADKVYFSILILWRMIQFVLSVRCLDIVLKTRMRKSIESSPL